MPCSTDGISPYNGMAISSTRAGDEARIGVAIVIGSVRSAQNVNTHDVPTITLLASPSDNTVLEISLGEQECPVTSNPTEYAAKPNVVDASNTGNTALALTLAFFTMS